MAGTFFAYGRYLPIAVRSTHKQMSEVPVANVLSRAAPRRINSFRGRIFRRTVVALDSGVSLGALAAVAESDTRLRAVFAAAGATVGSSNVVAIGIAGHSPAVRNVASVRARIAVGTDPGWWTVTFGNGLRLGVGIGAGSTAVTEGNSKL